MNDKLKDWRDAQGDLMLYSTAPNNGGYPIYYINEEHETICPECAQQQDRLARAFQEYRTRLAELRPKLEELDVILRKFNWGGQTYKLLNDDFEEMRHEANLTWNIIEGAIAEDPETQLECAVCGKMITEGSDVTA